MKIPEGWHKLRKTAITRKGDKYWYNPCNVWIDSCNWKTLPNKWTVEQSELIYIRKNK
jgi:hypothetical protein